jgi:hypothetical protein
MDRYIELRRARLNAVTRRERVGSNPHYQQTTIRRRTMAKLGQTHWAIAEGYISSQSSFSDEALVSHETACILNAGAAPAQVRITVFFADREPVGPYLVRVAPRPHAAFALQRSPTARADSARHSLFVGI